MFEMMLPAPNAQNHASNLAFLPNGELLCAWFSGTQEGMPDISIYLSRLPAGASAWTEPQRLSEDPTRSEQNPVLFPAPDGRLWLLWTSQKAGNQDSSIVMHRISDDGGRSWGPISVLFDKPGTFVRQPPLVLDDGSWILPIFRCVPVPGKKWSGDRDYSAVRISRDGGQSWIERPLEGSVGCVHMCIVKAGTELLALFRSRWADNIYQSRSRDRGLSWDRPRPTSLPNNNSSIQCAALASGRLALVYNDSSAAQASGRRASLYDEIEDSEAAAGAALSPGTKEAAASGGDRAQEGRSAFWGAPRAPLTVALSDDGGRSWPRKRDLEVGDGYCMTNNSRDSMNREYSYPSVCQGPDGLIHISYTYFRKSIKYVRIDEEWIAGRDSD